MKPRATHLPFLLLLPVATATPARPADGSPKLGYARDATRPHDERSVLVKIAADQDPDRVLRGHTARSLFGRWYRVRVPAGELASRRLQGWVEREGVEKVELDYVYSVEPQEGSPFQPGGLQSTFLPDDPYYSFQWHMPLVGMPAAWDRGHGEGATVAVLDTGITSLGEDLTCHVFQSPYNAITGESGPGVAEDDYKHGSHVAGTVAQCTGNGVGVTGVAFEAELMPVKILDETGNGTFADAAAGIDWAVAHGADVINMSLGAECDATWPECSTSIVNDAIDDAVANGVILVAAAGNQGVPFLSQPGNHPDVIPVTAVDLQKNRADYSNYDLLGDHSHVVAAPGGDTSVDLNGDTFPDGVLQETLHPAGCTAPGSTAPTAYCFWQGTSMATPHVAGAAAILVGLFPQATREQVIEALETSAEDLGSPGYDLFYGHGLLQVDRAIDALEALVEPVEPFVCMPGENVLCIDAYGDTYEVTMDWSRDAQGGKAKALALDSVGVDYGGAMYFNNVKNPELLLKILDFCTLGGSSYAVFYAATTDVEFVIRVRQASTGKSEVYTNTLGTPAPPVQDTSTVFTCP